MKTPKKTGIALGAGALLLTGLTTAPALAAPAPSAASAKVDAYMAAVPNGTKVSDNEITWENGEVRVVMSATSKSCAVGYYCVWEHSNFRGAMAAWTGSKERCKKFKFTNYWKNKVSSFRARGNCEQRNYFLKAAKDWQPDWFEPFEGGKAYVRYNDDYDYAAKGL
ncbi:peptidase inhibitor family I36 protein [Streptomyces sp. NPDC004111]|uniref:peptidase inhibitor family I36 protein n=1 Tax=Streptomyces sp. NPDC004111 TaxID=3364690 RepID=UPI003699794E